MFVIKDDLYLLVYGGGIPSILVIQKVCVIFFEGNYFPFIGDTLVGERIFCMHARVCVFYFFYLF